MELMPKPARPQALVLPALMLCVRGGEVWLHRAQGSRLRDEAETSLKAIARLKENRIAAWRDDQLNDAMLLAGPGLSGRDDGGGSQASVAADTGSFGLRMVHLWATHQLGGRIDIGREDGAVITVCCAEPQA